jgi:phosphopantothenoylcysteine decarboxylase / phosphopantothenate---cysteine ligase
MPPILNGKRIILGVSGGIACYKSVILASRLTQANAQVDVIMTEAATKFVAPVTFQAITQRTVSTDTFESWTDTGRLRSGHITLAHAADLFIVAPATAHTLGRLALGLGDELLSLTALSYKGPMLIAPAMETNMWGHPATRQHVETLRSWGVDFVGPAQGRLASGEHGAGRMVEPDEIFEHACRVLGRGGALTGVRVVITAGGTREPIDPVRFMGNHSTGKMGVALARAARDLGAETVLIHAPLAVNAPGGVTLIPIRTAQQMHDAVMEHLPTTDVLIGSAAVADYRPIHSEEKKIKKLPGQQTILLERTPDILKAVGERRGEDPLHPRLVVGFAAETDDLEENALGKLERKNMDMIVLNDVTAADSGFAVDTNRVIIFERGGNREDWPLMSKEEVAQAILQRIAARLGRQNWARR